jgi:hypothetical protein
MKSIVGFISRRVDKYERIAHKATGMDVNAIKPILVAAHIRALPERVLALYPMKATI